MKKLRKLIKANTRLISEYYTVLETTRPKLLIYEKDRVIEKFDTLIGKFPTTSEMSIQFVACYGYYPVSNGGSLSFAY